MTDRPRLEVDDLQPMGGDVADVDLRAMHRHAVGLLDALDGRRLSEHEVLEHLFHVLCVFLEGGSSLFRQFQRCVRLLVYELLLHRNVA